MDDKETNRYLKNAIECVNIVRTFKVFKDNFDCELIRKSSNGVYKLELKNNSSIKDAITFNFTITITKDNSNIIATTSKINNKSRHGYADIDILNTIKNTIVDDIITGIKDEVISYVKNMFTYKAKFDINYNFEIIFKRLYTKAKSLYNRSMIYIEYIESNNDAVKFSNFIKKLYNIHNTMSNIADKAFNYYSGIVKVAKFVQNHDMEFYDKSMASISTMTAELDAIQEEYEKNDK